MLKTLNSLLNTSISYYDVEADQLNQKIGYIDRETEEFIKIKDVIEQFEILYAKKNEIHDRIQKIKRDYSARENSIHLRCNAALRVIESSLIDLLKHDIDRENEFSSPDAIELDFKNDIIFVNGKANFSASSLAILRSCFYLSMLIASIKDKSFRYPRFMLLDSIEDKGMEPLRYHNLQKIIAEFSSQSEISHQIILSTSDIAPELKEFDGIIGSCYTKSNRTLSF